MSVPKVAIGETNVGGMSEMVKRMFASVLMALAAFTVHADIAPPSTRNGSFPVLVILGGIALVLLLWRACGKRKVWRVLLVFCVFFAGIVLLLPLRQPPIPRVMYSHEAIPVLGNLRTKIALYQYDHGTLPSEILRDTNPKDLKGKYSRPNHYQYLVMRNDTNCTEYAYFIGCFGDGDGLSAGTGFAIGEITSPSTGRKYIGTWERYRPAGDTQICFTSSKQYCETGRTLGCYVPEKSAFDNMTDKDSLLKMVDTMREHGWDFGGQ